MRVTRVRRAAAPARLCSAATALRAAATPEAVATRSLGPPRAASRARAIAAPARPLRTWGAGRGRSVAARRGPVPGRGNRRGMRRVGDEPFQLAARDAATQEPFEPPQ